MPRTKVEPKKEPARRRPESVREAMLNPSRRQLSRWQRDQQLQRLLLLAGLGLATLLIGVLIVGYVREVVLRGQETVAIVHGEPIAASEVVDTGRPLHRSLSQQAEMLRQIGMAQEAEQARMQLQILPGQALQMEIERRLIQREAQARQLTVSDEEVRAELWQRMQAEVEAQRGPVEAPPEDEDSPGPPTITDAEFDAAYRETLRRSGLDDLRFRQLLKDELLANKVRDAIGAEAPTSGEQVQARHILVEDEDSARELLQRLEDGENFEELATTESTDPGTAEDGGDLGWLPRGITDPSFEEAVFSATPGSGPQVVSTNFGWHVVEVLEHAQDRPVEEEYLEFVRMQHFQEWLAAAQESPEVEIHFSPATSDWIQRRLQGRLF